MILGQGFNENYKLPDGNYGEGDYIFNTTDLVIPSEGIAHRGKQTVSIIGNACFSNCNTIKTVVIPETVEIIQQYAFVQCRNLTKVTLSEGVKQIDRGVFMNCSSLTEINIPSSVTTMGENVFPGCPNELKIYVDKYESECSDWPSDWFGTGTVIYKK